MQRPLGQEGSEDAEEELIDSPAGVARAKVEGAGGEGREGPEGSPTSKDFD